MFQLFRVYTFVNVPIVFSRFYSASSDRITKMMSGNLNMAFAFKCLINHYPSRMLLLLIVLTSFPLSMMLQIVEGPIFYQIKNTESKSFKFNNYQNLLDCYWNFFSIITTVGYGEYFPLTNLGRILVVIISLVGIILVSLMIMTLQSSLKFESKEERSKIFVDRISAKSEIGIMGSDYFKSTLSFLVHRTKFMKEEDPLPKGREFIVKQMEQSLKQRLHRKKKLNHKIKNFNRDFENLDPIHSLQTKVAKISNTIHKLQETNTGIEKQLNIVLDHLIKKQKPSNRWLTSKANDI